MSQRRSSGNGVAGVSGGTASFPALEGIVVGVAASEVTCEELGKLNGTPDESSLTEAT